MKIDSELRSSRRKDLILLKRWIEKREREKMSKRKRKGEKRNN